MTTLPGGTLWGGGAPATAGTSQVSDLAYAALRKAGVLAAPGRGYSANELADTLAELSRFMGGLNTSRANFFTVRIDQYPTEANKQAYTLGPGGDWDGARPQKIVNANLLLPTDPV